MVDWKKDLEDLFEQEKMKKELNAKGEAEKKKHEPRVKEFFLSVVIPAFKELEAEFKKHGRYVEISEGLGSEGLDFASIGVSSFDTGENLTLRLEAYISRDHVGLIPTYRYHNSRTGREGSHSIGLKEVDCDISEISKENIINGFVKFYKDEIEL